MTTQLESKITDKCLKYLDSLIKDGYPIYYEHRSGNGGFNYKKGIPDLFIVINGMHIECEMKTPLGDRSTMQEKWAMKFQQLNIKYVCPKNFDEFKTYVLEVLKNYDR